MNRIVHRFLCWLPIWLVIALCSVKLQSGQSKEASQTPKPDSQYVGSTVCKACHPDVWLNFYKNPHFKSIASGTLPPADTGCESCHGPGKPHLLAHGGKASITAFSEISPSKALDVCLRCHSESISRSNIRRSPHTRDDVVCTSCHSIHKAATPEGLLQKSQAELCYGCHTNVRGDFSMPFKHRVNEGFMTCTDCHNPHGANAPTWRMAARPALMNHAFGNEEPCVKCHTDKRGPFAFEHPPVRVEGCEACHSPHGSTNSRLLKRPVVFTVCLECHNGAGSYGRQGDGIQPLSQAHNMTDPRYQNCTSCHVRIHGSNTDPLFLR